MSEVAVCSIGSTDPWNAAGLGLDIRALAECGVRPLTVVAGVTAQSGAGLSAAFAVPPGVIVAQLRDLAGAPIAAYRIGALLDVASVAAVAAHVAAAGVPVVYDPVLAPSAGGRFADDAVRDAIGRLLLPVVTLLTPNLEEAAVLGGRPVGDEEAMIAVAGTLAARGPAVLVKGGHLGGVAVDVLVMGSDVRRYEAPRLPGSLRGTGCLLACAAAAALARGASVPQAVADGRAFVQRKLAAPVHAGGMNVAY